MTIRKYVQRFQDPKISCRMVELYPNVDHVLLGNGSLHMVVPVAVLRMAFVMPEMVVVLVILLMVLWVEMVFVTLEIALPAGAVFNLAAVLETLELVLPMEMVVALVVLMLVLRVGMLFPMETVVVVLMVVLSVDKVSVPLVAFRVCFAW